MKSYEQKFTDYAPELGAAISMMEDHEFRRELDSNEVTWSAFSVCDAFSEFWAAWHGGQSSHLYSIGSGFAPAFDYDHRSSDMEENSTTREFYACLCVVFNCDDEIRWEIFGR